MSTTSFLSQNRGLTLQRLEPRNTQPPFSFRWRPTTSRLGPLSDLGRTGSVTFGVLRKLSGGLSLVLDGGDDDEKYNPLDMQIFSHD
jgi:hypothetical protein